MPPCYVMHVTEHCHVRRPLSPIAVCNPSVSGYSYACSLSHPAWPGCSSHHDGLHPYHEWWAAISLSWLHAGIDQPLTLPPIHSIPTITSGRTPGPISSSQKSVFNHSGSHLSAKSHRHLLSTPTFPLIRSSLLFITPLEFTKASLRHAQHSCHLTMGITVCWQQHNMLENVLQLGVLFQNDSTWSVSLRVGLDIRHSDNKHWNPRNQLGSQ